MKLAILSLFLFFHSIPSFSGEYSIRENETFQQYRSRIKAIVLSGRAPDNETFTSDNIDELFSVAEKGAKADEALRDFAIVYYDYPEELTEVMLQNAMYDLLLHHYEHIPGMFEPKGPQSYSAAAVFLMEYDHPVLSAREWNEIRKFYWKLDSINEKFKVLFFVKEHKSTQEGIQNRQSLLVDMFLDRQDGFGHSITSIGNLLIKEPLVSLEDFKRMLSTLPDDVRFKNGILESPIAGSLMRAGAVTDYLNAQSSLPAEHLEELKSFEATFRPKDPVGRLVFRNELNKIILQSETKPILRCLRHLRRLKFW